MLYIKGNSIKPKISDDRHIEFEFIINLYLDFSQKEKVSVLVGYCGAVLVSISNEF